MNNKLKMLFSIGFFILLVGAVYASGVVTPYWSDHPLKLAPGESTTVTLSLQNMVGSEDITLRGTISGLGIATITDSNQDYFVPIGNDNVPVDVKISVPKNATIGSTYDVGVSFKEVSSGSGGMVHVATGFTTYVPVQVVGETQSLLYNNQPKQNYTWEIVVGLALLALIIGVYIKRRRV